MANPFSWSEDFGYFSNKYKSLLFWIGFNQPQLHNPDFHFPEDIIKKTNIY